MLSIIATDKQASVTLALSRTFPGADITSIELLAGGLSGANVYKIIVNGEPYALKIDNAALDELVCECMETAAKAGIAPALHYIDKEEAVTIMGFIEKKALRSAFGSTDLLLTELAGRIRSIHEMPLFSRTGSLLQSVESLIAHIRTSPLFTPALFEDLFDYFELVMRHYPWFDTDKVSSHNDLNPNNLVCDGEKIWIIDWDAAFQNDRYVDLAITANFFVTTGEQELQFLTAYFGPDLTTYNIARFFIMRQITRLVYAILMFRLAAASAPRDASDRREGSDRHEASDPREVSGRHEASDLHEVSGLREWMEDPELKTATLQSVGAQLASGQLSLGSGKGQLFFGRAMLQEALVSMRSPRFHESILALATASE